MADNLVRRMHLALQTEPTFVATKEVMKGALSSLVIYAISYGLSRVLQVFPDQDSGPLELLRVGLEWGGALSALVIFFIVVIAQVWKFLRAIFSDDD